jgi:hypothetical protein
VLVGPRLLASLLLLLLLFGGSVFPLTGILALPCAPTGA